MHYSTITTSSFGTLVWTIFWILFGVFDSLHHVRRKLVLVERVGPLYVARVPHEELGASMRDELLAFGVHQPRALVDRLLNLIHASEIWDASKR